jgi:hypothetical protein
MPGLFIGYCHMQEPQISEEESFGGSTRISPQNWTSEETEQTDCEPVHTLHANRRGRWEVDRIIFVAVANGSNPVLGLTTYLSLPP